MKEHDAVFLESIISIVSVALCFTMIFMILLVAPRILGTFVGYVTLDQLYDQLTQLVVNTLIGFACYSAISFLDNFRQNRIDPYLPA